MDESKPKRRDDWAEMLREIDELWYHLMKSGELINTESALKILHVTYRESNIILIYN